MGDRVLKRIAEYIRAHRWKKNWQRVLTSLAAVVVFCTTYALILPAITLEWPAKPAATVADAERRATPDSAVKRTAVSDDDAEADVDLIFDLDYDLATRRFLTKSARDLGVDVDMGVPEWMLTDWDAVPEFDGELTGVWARDLLAVAESQVGYLSDYEGKSYYGARYGKPYDEWDAMFVSYCLELAEVPEDVIPRETSAAELAGSLADTDPGRFVEAEGHTPEPGELLFLDTDGDGRADRVGIVAAYDAGTGELKVIEGDYRTEIEQYAADAGKATPGNAEKATPGNAKKATPGNAEKPTSDDAEKATPGDARVATNRASPSGVSTEKKETVILKAPEEKKEADRTVYDAPGKEFSGVDETGTCVYTMAGMPLTGCACLLYRDTRRKRGRRER